MVPEQYRYLVGIVLIALLAGCLFFAFGILDQEHWTAFTQGLISILANGAKP